MTDNTEALPPLTDEDRQFLHYNPNTDDLVEFVQNYARAALAQRQQAPVLQQARAALLEMARGCSSCQDGPDDEFCCRKTQWDAIQAIDALTAAPSAQAEPVAWCALTPSGKIAHFDGKPMVMVGPVGNEHHTTPLIVATPPAQAEPQEPLPVCADKPHAVYVEGYGYVDAKAVRAIESAHGIGKQEGK